MLYDEDFSETLFFFAINGSSLLRENGHLARREEEEFQSSKIRRSFQCRQGAITILTTLYFFLFPIASIFWIFLFKYFVGLGIGF
jgi:hypothetical protein